MKNHQGERSAEALRGVHMLRRPYRLLKCLVACGALNSSLNSHQLQITQSL